MLINVQLDSEMRAYLCGKMGELKVCVTLCFGRKYLR